MEKGPLCKSAYGEANLAITPTQYSNSSLGMHANSKYDYNSCDQAKKGCSKTSKKFGNWRVFSFKVSKYFLKFVSFLNVSSHLLGSSSRAKCWLRVELYVVIIYYYPHAEI